MPERIGVSEKGKWEGWPRRYCDVLLSRFERAEKGGKKNAEEHHRDDGKPERRGAVALVDWRWSRGEPHDERDAQ